jgi:DNA primase
VVSQFIPEETIQEVLLRVDIVDVISDYVLLKKGGASYKGLCPFHSEKTPSFTVSPSKGLFYCFGCQASGNVFRFLMQHENVTFPEAVRLLAARYGVALPDRAAPRQQDDALQQLYRLHEAATAFFHRYLLQDPAAQQARAYCRQRQITSEVATRFALGYAPAAWDVLCGELQRQGFAQELLVRSGLVVVREDKGGVYDRFRQRLIFPIHDRLGRPVAFGGRSLEGVDASYVPKYLNSPETPIFHKGRTLYGLHLAKPAIRQAGRVIIVEGYTDVLACHRRGVTHVVGTLGTALTEQHVALLKGLAREIILVFDSDAAGGAATERGIGLFLEAGARVRIVELPAGEDPDSFLRQHDGADFLRCVDGAMTFLDYLLARAQRLYDLRTPVGQADCVARILPLLHKVESQVEQWGYVTLLAEKIGVPVDILRREMPARAVQTAATRSALPVSLERPAASWPRLEYDLLQLVLHDVRLLEEVQRQITPEDFETPLLQSVYTLLLRLAAQGVQTFFPGILEHAENDAQRQLLARMAAESVRAEAAECRRALHDYVRGIRRRQTQAQLQGLKAQIREAERSANTSEQQRLLQEYTALSRASRAAPQAGTP